MNLIPHGKHQITEADKQAVLDALEADFITQGPRIAAFENAFARYVKADFGIAVANGTAALHLCTLALDVKPADKVITSPITFVASANCVAYVGGEVLFADIDPSTYTLDPNKVEDLLKREKGIKGIIPVDFAGQPADLPAFRSLADKYDLWIIEDACHAPGGHYTHKEQTHHCGDGSLADMAIFSFHPVKHIAAGEGGMITTKDPNLAKRAAQLRTHGITKDADEMELYEGGWYYEMQMLGYNYRLTDFQAALGLSQLNRAEENLAKRMRIAKRYQEAFDTMRGVKGHSGYHEGHAYHLYILQVTERKALYDYLRTKNILCQIHYIPVHLQPYYRQFGWKRGDFPHAEAYYDTCISLPMYPSLLPEEQELVIAEIARFLKA